MMTDSLHVALMSEMLDAASPQRRRAARLLLELARSGCVLISERHIEAMRASAGPLVAAEAEALLAEFGADLDPRRGAGHRNRDEAHRSEASAR